MTDTIDLSFAPLADSALLIRVSSQESVDLATVQAVWRITDAVERASIPGLVDIVPAYATILLMFDPVTTSPDRLEQEVRAAVTTTHQVVNRQIREMTIPVAYGGEYGPDLDEVARHTRLTPEEVIARHAAAHYIVACMGFAPGWAYLLGLPPELEIPRLPNPRTRVPAGSVGIGGAQTGIYPLETPGGWRLIGRTPLRMFDPNRAEPSLLRPGDRVRFQPISHEQFRALECETSVSGRGELAAGQP